MPIDVNVTINPSPAVVARLESMEGVLKKMSQSLDDLTANIATLEQKTAQLEETLKGVDATLDALRASGQGATPSELAALSARVKAVTEGEDAAIAAVPPEDLPPTTGQNPTE